MIEQASDTPGYGSGYGFGYAAAAVPPPPLSPRSSSGYELRPLSVGEILDRTFSLYRQRFWLYCGLAAGAAGFQTLAQLLQVIFLSTPGKMANAKDAKTALLGAGGTMLIYLIYFGAYSVTQGATVSAVLASYLGHETSMRTALKAVGKHWWRYVLILLWQFWSMMWIFVLLFVPAVVLVAMHLSGLAVLGSILMFVAMASLVYGFIAYIRNSLAIAASVMEGLKVRKSMQRSKTLAAGNKWRIFLLMLLLFALSMVAGMLQVPILAVIGLHPAGRHFAVQGLSMLIAFISSSLIGPVGAIGFCLFYIDARVRKEGFDIEALMDPTLGSAMPRAVAAPVDLLPSGFAPSGFTAASTSSPFAPTGFTASSSPFPPSEFTAQTAVAPPPPSVGGSPFAPSGFAAPAMESAAETQADGRDGEKI
jgi:hypothetical protein